MNAKNSQNNKTTVVPLSALQHYLYCPRQCALIHVERLWADNFATAQGNVLHEKAHSAKDEYRNKIKIIRSLPVWSEIHKLTGICDVVELFPDQSIIPIEYKRGRPKAHKADEIQLCAQAICLEENFKKSQGSIDKGYLFYGKLKRRSEIILDDSLRALTLKTANQVRKLIDSEITPSATYQPKLCNRCSLINLCEPKSMRLKRGTKEWFQSQIKKQMHSN